MPADDVSNRVFQEAEQMLSVPGELTTPCRLSCFWQMDMRWPATETKSQALVSLKVTICLFDLLSRSHRYSSI
jgi:hypothetical protein